MFLKKLLCLIWVLAQFIPASAFAVDVVHSPLVQADDLQFDYKGKYQEDANPKLDNVHEEDVGVGYGLTDRWRTRLETELIDQQGQGIDFKYIALANTISLTGNDSSLPTALFVNVAVANRIYINNYVVAGLSSLRNIGPTTNTVNLLLKHEYGDSASNKSSLVYRFQAKYNLYDYFKPGFELFGDTNKQDAFENQLLKIGPGVFGSFQLGAQRVSYELAFLCGATPTTPNGTLQWRLSYAFP